MNYREIQDKLLPFAKQNLLALSLAVLGMMFFVYGLIGLFVSSKSASEDIRFEASSEKNSAEVRTIFVDVEGAVVKQGVYKLAQDSRIQDALIAAGGLSALADRNYVAKSLNLATKLTDGAKVYIPQEGETTSNAGITGSSGVLTGQININFASESQLESLPGVGSVTAQKIISGRPYISVDELLSKKIVGKKVYDQIKDKITIY